jgi:hypothetical protein
MSHPFIISASTHEVITSRNRSTITRSHTIYAGSGARPVTKQIDHIH